MNITLTPSQLEDAKLLMRLARGELACRLVSTSHYAPAVAEHLDALWKWGWMRVSRQLVIAKVTGKPVAFSSEDNIAFGELLALAETAIENLADSDRATRHAAQHLAPVKKAYYRQRYGRYQEEKCTY